MKTISIITVSLNVEKTIETCIQSVLSQSYPHYEYIIIDGKSSDGTLAVIEKYADRIHRVICEPDRGIYDAMNKGIRLAKGDIVGFLNADDVLAYPDVFADIIKTFQKEEVESCFGDLVYVEQSNLQAIRRYWKMSPFGKSMFYNGVVPPHPTFYVKREVYAKLHGFDPRFRIAADFELMLRYLVKNQISTAYIPKILVKMRMNGTSGNSLKNIILGLYECYRAFTLNKLSISALFFPKALLFRLQQVRSLKQVPACARIAQPQQIPSEPYS